MPFDGDVAAVTETLLSNKVSSIPTSVFLVTTSSEKIDDVEQEAELVSMFVTLLMLKSYKPFGSTKRS